MRASEWVSIITSIIMVLITAAYVVATIKIQKANEKAAKASNDQLEESKRQFNENRRLDVMPYLQFEIRHNLIPDYSMNLTLFGHNLSGEYTITICVKNIGRGTAKDIKYIWHNFEGQYDRVFPFSALQNGDSFIVLINFGYERTGFSMKSAYFDLMYKDFLEHDYTQKIEFLLDWNNEGEYLYLVNLTTNPPVLVK